LRNQTRVNFLQEGRGRDWPYSGQGRGEPSGNWELSGVPSIPSGGGESETYKNKKEGVGKKKGNCGGEERERGKKGGKK